MRQKRVAIYARVSTTDKDQNPETQLLPLREYCKNRNLEVVAELVDHSSGKSTRKRPNYLLLRDLARKRKIDVVLVWRYDRFARSVQELTNALEEFRAIGVDFMSYMENVDTTTPHGKLLFHMMAGFAEFVSSLIGENVKAGLTRAKAQGTKLGRRGTDPQKLEQIQQLHAQGMSMKKIAKQLNIGYATVHRTLNTPKEES